MSQKLVITSKVAGTVIEVEEQENGYIHLTATSADGSRTNMLQIEPVNNGNVYTKAIHGGPEPWINGIS